MRWSVAFLGTVGLCGLLWSMGEAKSYEDFSKEIKELRKMTPSAECKTVFRKCAGSIIMLWPLLGQLKKSWDDFQNVPCVKTSFDKGFPKLDWQCKKGGNYEEAINCMMSDDITKFFKRKSFMIRRAKKCLLSKI